MSTAALKTSNPAARLLSQVDLWAAGLALPIFVIAGLPVAGWLVGAGAWFLQRLVQAYFRRRLVGETEPKRIAGTIVGSTLIRGWAVAAAVLVAGLQSQKVGLSAAMLVVALFTFYFAQSLLERWMESGQ